MIKLGKQIDNRTEPYIFDPNLAVSWILVVSSVVFKCLDGLLKDQLEIGLRSTPWVGLLDPVDIFAPYG